LTTNSSKASLEASSKVAAAARVAALEFEFMGARHYYKDLALGGGSAAPAGMRLAVAASAMDMIPALKVFMLVPKK
jgi:hypothetical protein